MNERLIKLYFNAEKVNSVRYDSKDDEGIVDSLYIMKRDFGSKPWPKEIEVTVRW